MSGHLIREATRADLPGLLALYRELRPNDPAMPDSEASSSWDHLLGSPVLLVIVAESGSSIASTCMLAIVPSRGTWLRTHPLEVTIVLLFVIDLVMLFLGMKH